MLYRQTEFGILLLMLVADALLFSFTSYSITGYTYATLIISIGCVCIVWYRWYRVLSLRHTSQHAKMLRSQTLFVFGVFSIFNVTVGYMDYVLTGTIVYPEWDKTFVSWDAFFGFHWLYWYHFVHHHTWLNGVLRNGYNMAVPQTLIILVALPLTGHVLTARIFLLRYMVVALITMILGILMPAVGAFAFYHLPIATHVKYIPVMHALRDGTLHTVNFDHLQGLVVFPSFHAALATMCLLAAWNWPYTRVPFVLLNVGIILSAPSEGGHYAVDVIVGVAISLVVACLINAKSYPRLAAITS